VITTGGDVSTSTAVLASGPWSGPLAALLGCNLPLRPRVRYVFVTGPVPRVRRDAPLTVAMSPPFYFRPEGEGIVFSAAEELPQEDIGPDTRWSALESAVARALRRLPLLQDAVVLRGWSGSRTITPDRLPLVGALPGLHGVYVMAGCNGRGIMHGPPLARRLARLVTGAGAEELAAFDPARFEPGRELECEVL
jgi:glycine/D-amino acid oxidase-like deaminating enzyme